MEIMDLVVTIGIGVLGAYLGRRFKVPASFMLGPMFAVAVFSILTDGATYPTFMKNFTQMVSGTFIGAGISKKDVKLLRKMIIPAILNIVVLIIFSLLMAIVLAKVGEFSFATAAFATAPGGLVDMVIVSLDMGADTAIVSVMQTVRLFSIIGLFPAIFSRMISKEKVGSFEDIVAPQKVAEQKRGRIWLTALIGMIGGVIGFFQVSQPVRLFSR